LRATISQYKSGGDLDECAIFAAPPGRAGTRLASLGAAVLGLVPVAEARVTQINITTVESPTFAGASFGSVGQYERIEGTFTGEVDPKDPSNADIVDIALAPKNAHGKVTYSADFQILRPIDLSKGNHRVIFELPNRGRTNILGILNDSTTPNDTTKSGDPGIGFVMTRDIRSSRAVGIPQLCTVARSSW